MFCNQCGNEISSKTKFCNQCGNKLSSTHNDKKATTKPKEQEKLSKEQEKIILEELLLIEAKKAANRAIFGGIGWILAGLIITGISYAFTDPGGSYFIFWGLSVYGLYKVIKGIAYRIAPKNLVNETLNNSEDSDN